MPLLAAAIRASDSQTARFDGAGDMAIVVQQISGRRFGDNETSFAVDARYNGTVTRFDAEDLLEAMRHLRDLGVPDAIVQGEGWQATTGPGGVDPQAPAHAW
jgi:hypothetical protein